MNFGWEPGFCGWSSTLTNCPKCRPACVLIPRWYLSGPFASSALDLNQQAAFAHLMLGKILIAEGKPQQALSEIEKEPTEWGKLTGELLVYHALGRKQDSNVALAGLIARHGTDAAYQIAQVYAYRGESDKSLEWLERAYKQRDGGLADIKADPQLKPKENAPTDIIPLS